MRLATAVVSVCCFARSIRAFATPSFDVLGLTARQDANADPCSLANDPAINASVQLSSWLECQVNGFFPYPANGPWDTVFANAFSPSLLATFNDTHYDYDGWLQLYHNFNVTLGQNFAPFKHGFINSVGVPNSNGDKGGFAYLLGWEGGYHSLLKTDLYFTDATFAVIKDVHGSRKIVEMRESSNIPNTAPLPGTNEWTCSLTGNY